MYFHYIYKASININFLIKVTVNYHVIDFYINFHLIYNITVLNLFVQNFIICKIISYYFNSKVSSFLNFNISLVKRNIWALCFLFWTFNFFIWSARLPRPIIKFRDLTSVRYSIRNTSYHRAEQKTLIHPCGDCI